MPTLGNGSSELRDDSAEYYRLRAAAERERAKKAATPEGVRIHIAIADAYERRAKDLSA